MTARPCRYVILKWCLLVSVSFLAKCGKPAFGRLSFWLWPWRGDLEWNLFKWCELVEWARTYSVWTSAFLGCFSGHGAVGRLMLSGSVATSVKCCTCGTVYFYCIASRICDIMICYQHCTAPNLHACVKTFQRDSAKSDFKEQAKPAKHRLVRSPVSHLQRSNCGCRIFVSCALQFWRQCS